MEQKAGKNHGGKIVISNNIIFNKNEKTIYVYKHRFSPEDYVAIAFARVLEDLGIKYAVVAGYIAILFGRARRSDDIDFLAESVDEEIFLELCRELSRKEFILMQGDIFSENSIRKLYRDYIVKGYGVRFMYKDIVLPNIEFKLTSTVIHKYAIGNSYRAVLNDKDIIRISPLELQIAYKLALGSGKDIGDAVFLYALFREALDLEELYNWCNRLRADCGILEAGELVE